MACEAGLEMVRELRQAGQLPMYRADSIQAVLLAIEGQFRAVEQGVLALRARAEEGQRRPPAYIGGRLLIQRAQMLREKRYVLAYLVNRLWRIERACWERDASLHPSGTAAAASGDSGRTALLSPQEREYAERYQALLGWYGGAVGMGLLEELHVPPKDWLVEVRVRQDCGSVVMASTGETVRLAAGTMHFVARSDVELLIQSGKLEHVPPSRMDGCDR